MDRLLRQEKETLQKVLDSGKKDLSYNLQDFDGSVSLDELFEIREVIENHLSDYTGGSSIEGNGTNFNFTFNGKPFMLRVEKDDFHTKEWMKMKVEYWSEDGKTRTYEKGLETKRLSDG